MNNLIPMNLQFFAEEHTEPIGDNTTPEPDRTEQKENDPKPDKPITSDLDLNTQLQNALNEIAKLKRAQEKAASQAAEFKKKWQETLSEQEKASMEKAETEAKKSEEYEQMKRIIRIHDLTENFMDLNYPKDLAKKAAEAQVDGDTQALLTIQKQFQEQQKKTWEHDFLASRPDINVGGGSSTETYTKEQFEAMNFAERTKLKRENEAEYKRLLNM